jgi:AcrR family transcriptional regulator
MNTRSESPNGRQDRRVIRTRRNLRAALIDLILEKGYDAVTIEDITDHADLGRTTFYLHYKDKEELLLESIENTARELYSQVILASPPIGDHTLEDSLQAIGRVFQHAAENSILYRIIFKGGAASRVHHTIRVFLSEAVRPYFDYDLAGSAQSEMPLEVLSNYFSTSLLGFLTWWLENDMPYPPDQASRFFSLMFFDGIRKFLRN